jgi:TolB protein
MAMRHRGVTVGLVALLALPAGAAARATGAHASARNGAIVFQANAGASRQLFTINSDGSGLRQVTRLAGAEQPDWSPDSERIAFDVPAGGRPGIFTVRRDGSGLRKVALAPTGSSAAPAYSPDGDALAFEQKAGAAGIFVAAADGSSPRRVTRASATAEARDTASTWSPDGTRLAFTRVRRAGEAAIHVVGIDGSGLRRLTPWSLDASAASWSPDGSKLVFESYSTPHPGKSANLFTISPDGGAMTQLTHFGGGKTHAFGPAWSPDGTKIVWHKIGPRLDQLFVMDAGGANHRQLTHLPGNARPSHPDWGAGR